MYPFCIYRLSIYQIEIWSLLAKTGARSNMNVRTLCLAILYSGDATGYEIKKLSIEGKYSHFVDASFGSIYPALSRLEADEAVTFREEMTPGKPPRKVYSITDSGREEFVRSLLEPPAPDIYRSEFLMIAIFAHILPKEVVSRAIDTQIAHLEGEIAHLREIAGEEEKAGNRVRRHAVGGGTWAVLPDRIAGEPEEKSNRPGEHSRACRKHSRGGGIRDHKQS